MNTAKLIPWDLTKKLQGRDVPLLLEILESCAMKWKPHLNIIILLSRSVKLHKKTSVLLIVAVVLTDLWGRMIRMWWLSCSFTVCKSTWKDFILFFLQKETLLLYFGLNVSWFPSFCGVLSLLKKQWDCDFYKCKRIKKLRGKRMLRRGGGNLAPEPKTLCVKSQQPCFCQVSSWPVWLGK